MSKKITQKVMELLTPQDLITFENAIEASIAEKVEAKLSGLVKLKEEELKKFYNEQSAVYVKETVIEKLTAEKAKLVETYDKKLALIEQQVAIKLDSYLDHVIGQQISDATLERLAVNETLMPVVEGIRAVFNDNHLKINSKAQSTINSYQKEIDRVKEDLSESINRNIQLENELEKSATYLLIAEKTNGLTRTSKQRVVEMFKDKEFDHVEKNIDNYVGLIKESEGVKPKLKAAVKTAVKTKIKSVNEGAVVDVIKEPIKQDLKESTDEFDISDMANRYLI
jgi:hypothetical protein